MRKPVLRSLVAIAIVASVGLNVAADGRQAPAISMPGYPAPGALATVTLTSPGAEPRVRLRYKVSAGTKETLIMTTAMGFTANLAGMAVPPMEFPLLKMTAEVAVTSVAPDGDIAYNVAFTGMTTEAAAGADPSMVAMLQGAAESITGLKGHVVLTDRGINKSATVSVDAIADPNLRQILSAVSSFVESMSIAMPEEPVGVGAKWEVRQAQKAAGAQTFQRTECELVSVDAQGATIRVKSELTSPAQTIPNPLMPTSTVNVEKLTGTSTGTTTARFQSVIPSTDYAVTQSLAMAMDLGGQTQKMAVDTKIKVSIAAKKN